VWKSIAKSLLVARLPLRAVTSVVAAPVPGTAPPGREGESLEDMSCDSPAGTACCESLIVY